MSEGTKVHLVPKDVSLPSQFNAQWHRQLNTFHDRTSYRVAENLIKLQHLDTPPGQSGASHASAGLEPNLFDFLATNDIVDDPDIKEYIKRITQGNLFNQIAEKLQKMFKGVHAVEHYYSTMPDFDYRQYYSTMQQVMQHPLFTAYAERLADVLVQDPSIPRVLEKLTSTDSSKTRKAHIKTGQDLNSTIKEIENGDAMIKYLHDQGILQKMTEAEGFAAGGETDSSDDHTRSKVSVVNHTNKDDQENYVIRDVNGQRFSDRRRRRFSRLHRVCKVGEVELVEVVLVLGAKVNVRDKDRNTPLHYAAAYGHKECVELLLKYDACVDVYNVHKQTPVDVARLNNQNEIAKMILDTAYL